MGAGDGAGWGSPGAAVAGKAEVTPATAEEVGWPEATDEGTGFVGCAVVPGAGVG